MVALAAATAACARSSSDPKQVTFTTDIAPIVFANCSPCHHPGDVAPFSLLTYADVVKHADGAAQMTRRRDMPPSLPERGESPTVGARRLRDDQIGVLHRAVKS